MHRISLATLGLLVLPFTVGWAQTTDDGAKTASKKQPPAKSAEVEPPSEAKKPAGEKKSDEESKPAEDKPAEDKPAEDKPAEDKPAEDKPAEDKPAEDKPAEDKPTEDKPTEEDVLAGHSYHGEAFNEGARQRAYLMPGMGRVKFPATTKSDEAQKFIEQGVAQLHGFWYFEAERSFRQAAAIDPECAMAYWGMAVANLRNAKRSKGFIAEAVKRKAAVSERERMYIEAVDAYVKAGSGKKKDRAQAYTDALERLLYKYPDDLEAKAFLALQLWSNRSAGLKVQSHLAIDALLQQVFEVQPMHPAHHYRIHLWDYQRAETALTSAAVCGQTSPGIAHMWHMPGHIFSRLKRYNDAAWQQEASARVDHAHMMRDRVMPDQIHNFAHNNEWLIRNLNHVGRIRDALDLAKNMTELPQHPKYNTVDRRGSYSYGRSRLLETLSRYELWEQLVALSETPYLPPTSKKSEQLKRLRYLGMAHYRLGDQERGDALLAEVRTSAEQLEAARDKAGEEAAAKAKQEKKDEKAIEKAKQDARRKHDRDINEWRRGVGSLEGYQKLAQGDYKEAHALIKKGGGADVLQLALIQHLAGETDAAVKAAVQHADSHKNEVQPLAGLIDLLWRADRKDEAKKRFEQLREISAPIDTDLSPVFTRLAPIAAELKYPQDWRIEAPVANDVGERVALNDLGPFRWRPSPAPEWSLTDADGLTRASKQLQGKPRIVIFYLGYGCLHCAEQLQAFAPMVEQFAEAGLSMVAISTDDVAGLKRSIENYDKGKLSIPLLADPELNVFRAYRVFDDFEEQPLHGTFLIDGEGMVRWQDISYEPFMDPKFVLREAQRLLNQEASPSAQPAK